tara:strand:+ start:1913 stop:3169 length:1257 start_codon:yes stop_codon:yes gene_type:complete
MLQNEVEIEVLKHQIAFIESNHIHTGLVAGFGAGKSKAATFKCIDKLEEFYRLNGFKKGINVAYYLPTYPLIKGIAFDNFKEGLEERGIPYTLNETDKEFVTPIGKIIMRSMDNPATIVGYEVGYSLIDEADILPLAKMRKAFISIVARNRKFIPGNVPNCLDMVSTPEGFNFMYDFFVKNPSPNKLMIKASTYDNPYLPDSYIPTLRESYSEQEIEAYLNGEFVNLTSGNVYHTFDRKRNHSDREIRPREVLHIGMDFNITKMSAVVHVTDNNLITAVAEVTGAYDTPDMIGILKETYPNHKIVVYPDASGDNRKTSASDTDIDLLKKARFTVKVASKNPSVRDRITTVNAGFMNAKGESTYYVNTNNCPEYTEALEKLPYKNGVPDKESGFDHVTDGGGYCLYQMRKSNFVRAYVR